MKIGLVINPIAGVGAALAWKGTDDVAAAWEAVERGEKQPVWDIVNRAIASIPAHITIEWVLGGPYSLAVDGQIVYTPQQQSTAIDTHQAVDKLTEQDIELLLFVGGDGTATDVARHAGSTPILGIPGGVKIFSPCFLHRPEDLGPFLEEWEGETVVLDLLDLDEEAYRQGRTQSKLVSNATVPVSADVQAGKISWGAPDTNTYELLADRIKEEKWLDKSVLVGPGSTLQQIFIELGLVISLLGVDHIFGGAIEHLDCTADDIDKLDVDEIWLTPIGNQGHVLGRGNRQITPNVLAKVGKKGIRIFATGEKIRNTPELFIDSGDPELDKELQGYYQIYVGYHDSIMRKVV